jgi:hypothetical protein
VSNYPADTGFRPSEPAWSAPSAAAGETRSTCGRTRKSSRRNRASRARYGDSDGSLVCRLIHNRAQRLGAGVANTEKEAIAIRQFDIEPFVGTASSSLRCRVFRDLPGWSLERALENLHPGSLIAAAFAFFCFQHCDTAQQR